jgi:carbamate kinase
MRLVVALGGNALLQHGQPMTADNQRERTWLKFVWPLLIVLAIVCIVVLSIAVLLS